MALRLREVVGSQYKSAQNYEPSPIDGLDYITDS